MEEVFELIDGALDQGGRYVGRAVRESLESVWAYLTSLNHFQQTILAVAMLLAVVWVMQIVQMLRYGRPTPQGKVVSGSKGIVEMQKVKLTPEQKELLEDGVYELLSGMVRDRKLGHKKARTIFSNLALNMGLDGLERFRRPQFWETGYWTHKKDLIKARLGKAGVSKIPGPPPTELVIPAVEVIKSVPVRKSKEANGKTAHLFA